MECSIQSFAFLTGGAPLYRLLNAAKGPCVVRGDRRACSDTRGPSSTKNCRLYTDGRRRKGPYTDLRGRRIHCRNDRYTTTTRLSLKSEGSPSHASCASAFAPVARLCSSCSSGAALIECMHAAWLRLYTVSRRSISCRLSELPVPLPGAAGGTFFFLMAQRALFDPSLALRCIRGCLYPCFFQLLSSAVRTRNSSLRLRHPSSSSIPGPAADSLHLRLRTPPSPSHFLSLHVARYYILLLRRYSALRSIECSLLLALYTFHLQFAPAHHQQTILNGVLDHDLDARSPSHLGILLRFSATRPACT